jgi:ComF family protein
VTPARPSAGGLPSQVWHGLLDVVYPPRCLVCDAFLPEGSLCEACIAQFRPLLPPYCIWCGVPVAAPDTKCARCDEGPAPAYDSTHALGHYRGTLRDAIHRLKYGGKSALARPLGTLLAESLRAHLAIVAPHSLPFDVAVPVPLHSSRLRRRGFNQSERLGAAVAGELGLRFDGSGLRRLRSTGTQTNLSREERLRNMRGAFAARSADRFTGLSVLLVDDVITTTTTVSECARVIRNAGAAHVFVTAIARAD